jgi:hypothetical protein
MLSSIKKIVADAFTIFGISVIIVFLAEATLRAFFPQILMGTSITGTTFSQADALLGMRYMPGARWRFSHPEYSVEYVINARGFRDRKEHPVPKPQGTIRVLLVGDSFTFGQGVNYNQSWPVMVEKRLQELGDNHIDLIKAGVQGMDTRSEFFLMQQLLEQYQYDVVVVGFLINDLYTNTLYRLEENDGTSTNDTNKSHDSWMGITKQVFIRNSQRSPFHLLNFVKRLVISSDQAYCKLYLLSPQKRKFLAFPLSQEAKHKLEITKLLLEMMASYSHSLGKKLIVLSMPQQFQVLCFDESKRFPDIDVTFYDRYFSEVAKRNGFTWITTLEAFNTSTHNKDELFYRFDGHLTPVGNRVVAEVFLKRIVPLINAATSS